MLYIHRFPNSHVLSSHQHTFSEVVECETKCSYLIGNLLVLNSLAILDFFFFPLGQTFRLLSETAPLGKPGLPETQETKMETARERDIYFYLEISIF